MRCPSCGNPESKVVDSRPSEDGTAIRRRRECLECGRRFTTYVRFASVYKDFRNVEEFAAALEGLR